MLHSSHYLHTLKMLAVAPAITVQNDNGAAVVVARAPHPIAVVSADSLGQTGSRSVKIHRRRIAPAVGKDGSAGTLFRRKAVVNLRDLLHHLLPAKLVGKPLRQ